MRNDTNDYLSEFEREFEMEFEHESEYELEDSESDSEFELEGTESDSEFELEDAESDSEFELEATESDSEFELEDAESDSEFELESENGLETRFFEVLNGDHESEYEFEQQLNELMHEAERDYFWKKAFRKVGSFAKKLKDNKFVQQAVLTALKSNPYTSSITTALTSLPIGDIVKAATQVSRKGLRSGLTQLATDYAKDNLGGVGNLLASSAQGEMDNEVLRGQVRDFLNIAEQAYENLADEINKVDRAKSAQQVQQILKNAPKVALLNAIQAKKIRGNGKGRLVTRRVIPLPTGAKVLVTRSKIVIITPKRG